MNKEPNIQPTNTNEICTESCCTNKDDDQKIKWVKCKRQVHYIFALYQLSLFFPINYVPNTKRIPSKLQESRGEWMNLVKTKLMQYHFTTMSQLVLCRESIIGIGPTTLYRE